MPRHTGARSAAPSRDVIIGNMIALIARSGIRGATMRDIAAECGVTSATIAALFGNKDGLVGACFAALARADQTRLEARVAEAEAMAIASTLAAPFLWTLVEDAWGEHRTDMLALIELWLAAPGQPELTRVCEDWIVIRRDALRRLAVVFGADQTAFDILGLHLLSESCFAVSCGNSYSYRLVAAAGFAEAVDLLMSTPHREPPAGIKGLADHFYADPGTEIGESSLARQARSIESRDRIINAAASIIEEGGLASVTNRAVAERADVSLALTTYHFKVVSELAFAGILRVFQRTNANIAKDQATGAETGLVSRISGRVKPSGIERLRSRGMAEISLAAARGGAPANLGLDMRRQRGTLTHAAARRSASGAQVTRTRAASHALWSSAAFLVAAAIPESADVFDFDAQAKVAAKVLLAAT